MWYENDKKKSLTISASRSEIAEIKYFPFPRKVFGFLTWIREREHITFSFGYTFIKSKAHKRLLGFPPYGIYKLNCNLLHTERTTTAEQSKNSRNLLPSTLWALTIEGSRPQIFLASSMSFFNFKPLYFRRVFILT